MGRSKNTTQHFSTLLDLSIPASETDWESKTVEVCILFSGAESVISRELIDS